MDEDPGSYGNLAPLSDSDLFLPGFPSPEKETAKIPPATNQAPVSRTEQNETPLGQPEQKAESRAKRPCAPEKHKLVRQQKEEKPSKSKSIKAISVEGRKLRLIPLSAIDLDKDLAKRVTDYGGQFDIDLHFLTKIGGAYLADILRIHVVPQDGRYSCVAGFIALQVLKNLKDPPSHVAVEVHENEGKGKDKPASKIEIDRRLAVEFQFLPPLFWWKHEYEERGHRIATSLFDKSKSKLDKKLETFVDRFNAACSDETCSPLIHRPSKKELHRVFRVARRTADKLRWPGQ